MSFNVEILYLISGSYRFLVAPVNLFICIYTGPLSFNVVILFLLVASIGSCRTGLIYLFSYIYADPTGFNDVNLYLIVANVCCFVYRSVAHRLNLYS